MDAINTVFNVFVGAVLVIGAIGLGLDVDLPEPKAAKSEDASTGTGAIWSPDDAATDVCMLPECNVQDQRPSSFVETKTVVVIPAPKPGGQFGPVTADPVPATIKHGDDHPSTHSKRGRERADAKPHREKDRDKDRDDERKDADKDRKERKESKRDRHSDKDDERDEDDD